MLRKQLLITIVLLLTSACITQKIGSKQAANPQVLSQLESEKMSKADIYKTLGQPHDIAYNNQNSAWIYYFITERPGWSTFIPIVGMATGGGKRNTKVTEIYFNPNNVFIQAKATEKEEYVNIWSSLTNSKKNYTPYQRVEREMSALGLPYNKKAIDRVKYFTN